MDLSVAVYRLSRSMPKDEVFGLTSQLRRAAVSVPANIAEGHGRLHRADYLRHLSISRGSLAETRTHLEIAVRAGLLRQTQVQETEALAEEVWGLLDRLIEALRRSSRKR
jgi:four helix bundle protein